LYSAADVFLCPTLEEAFGKTMAEAMACGTPVAAFRCSAPADLVEPGRTGFLAEPGQPGSLLQGLLQQGPRRLGWSRPVPGARWRAILPQR
jgi:glycosyltransferase involved in cell wall biosynthesis